LPNNQFVSIVRTGIETLPLLHTLNLRDNNFPSLNALLISLRGCNALTSLHIQHDTVDKAATSLPVPFTATAFAELRGLRLCDGVKNPKCIRNDPLAVKAIDVLSKLGRVGPNNLKRVNLADKGLPRSLFIPVLSALSYLHVRGLNATGNEWRRAPLYQDTILLLLGSRLSWLDGEEITVSAHMRAAARTNKNEEVSDEVQVCQHCFCDAFVNKLQRGADLEQYFFYRRIVCFPDPTEPSGMGKAPRINPQAGGRMARNSQGPRIASQAAAGTSCFFSHGPCLRG
jgi:hypothetical protein